MNRIWYVLAGYVLGIAYTLSVFTYISKRTEARLAREWSGTMEQST